MVKTAILRAGDLLVSASSGTCKSPSSPAFLHECLHHGCRCFSCRPGLIGPHSKTGHANTQDWFFLLVVGLYKLGCYPIGPGCDNKNMHMVPVDTVAKSVVHLAWESSNGE